ncbi:MAG TPA: AAA family ATPase [Thermomicrobiales bacterium]|nr:AAA family ATPase [Thermomicrobiales bacterium]
MSAYRHLGLARDPFAPSSSDHAMFHRTLGHEDCLQRLQRAIHRQSGLALVLGEAGYGKSTIKTALLHELRRDADIEIGIIDDPRACRTDVQFLRAILDQFGLVADGRSALDLISGFQHYIGDHDAAGRTMLLVIDEGHHLTSAQLEIVRTLLSFDPNGDQSQRVMVVIFAQPELEEKIRRKRNLARRLSMTHTLNPLNRRDTAALIGHRLNLAGQPVDAPYLLPEDAIEVIYECTGGVPRAIIDASDACLDAAIALGQTTVDAALAARASAIAVARANASGGTPHPSDRANGHHAVGEGPVQTRIPFAARHDEVARTHLHGGEQ